MNNFWSNFIPKLWGVLWVIGITAASFGTVLALIKWIVEMMWE
jgi:hypothetical protein